MWIPALSTRTSGEEIRTGYQPRLTLVFLLDESVEDARTALQNGSPGGVAGKVWNPGAPKRLGFREAEIKSNPGTPNNFDQNFQEDFPILRLHC